MLIPVAVSIVFGMFSSTVLVLTVIPCIYVALQDFLPAGDTPETDPGTGESARLEPAIAGQPAQ